MYNSQNKYEEEINIFTLLWFVVSKWKSIVIVAVIGLVLGAGYVALSAPSAAPTSGDNAATEDMSAYDTAVQIYNASSLRVETLETYITESPLMNMNPYDTYKGTVVYVMDGEQTNLIGVEAAIYSYARDGALLAELAEIGPYTVAELEQLMGVGQTRSETVSFMEPTPGQAYVRVSVIVQTEEELIPLLKQLEISLGEKLATLQTQQDIVSYELLSSEIKSITATEVAEYQSDIRRKYADEKENLATYKSNMDALEESGAAVASVGVDKSDLIKYGGVGFVGLGVLACVVWILVYCFGGRLYGVSSIEEKYGVKVLGNICTLKFNNPLDRWIARKRCGVYATIAIEEQREIILTTICNELKKLGNINKIFVTSSVEKGMTEASYFVERLKEQGYEVEAYKNAVGNATALKVAATCDAVILWEHKADSNCKAVETEVSVLSNYAQCLGMVVVGNGF